MSTREELVAAVRFEPQGTDRWEKLTKGKDRLFEITASVAPNIVGVGYVSPIMQWKYDTGLAEPPKEGYTAELQQRGHEDEDLIVQYFLAWWHETYHRPLAVFPTGTWQHPKYPWLAASPDRYLYDIEYGDVYLLEAKSRQEDRDAMPPTDGHYVQCQLQLECVPEALGLFYISANVRSALTDTPTVICAIRRDAAFVRDEVLPKLLHHRTLVASRTPPAQRQSKKPQFLNYRDATVKQLYP